MSASDNGPRGRGNCGPREVIAVARPLVPSERTDQTVSGSVLMIVWLWDIERLRLRLPCAWDTTYPDRPTSARSLRGLARCETGNTAGWRTAGGVPPGWGRPRCVRQQRRPRRAVV